MLTLYVELDNKKNMNEIFQCKIRILIYSTKVNFEQTIFDDWPANINEIHNSKVY